MESVKNCLHTECGNDNCIIKMSVFKNGLDSVTDIKKIDKFKARQDIFFENNSVNGVYFILNGVVKVYKYNRLKNIIIRLATSGDMIGHRGIGKKKFPISAQALKSTELCFIDKNKFFELLNQSASFAINMMLFFGDELDKEEVKLTDLANMTVYEKGKMAIKIMIESLGLIKDDFINNSDLLTRKEIGELVGLTANQVTRTLKELHDDKLILVKLKRIKILDLSAF